MKPTIHLISSAAVSAVAYGITRSPVIAGSSFVTGVFIDLDHVVDYVREYALRFSPRHFRQVFAREELHKLVLPFHAWEWIAILWLLSLTTAWNPWISGVSLGATLHLAIDQVGNNVSWRSYLFLWRLRNGFSSDSFFWESRKPRKQRPSDADQ